MNDGLSCSFPSTDAARAVEFLHQFVFYSRMPSLASGMILICLWYFSVSFSFYTLHLRQHFHLDGFSDFNCAFRKSKVVFLVIQQHVQSGLSI